MTECSCTQALAGVSHRAVKWLHVAEEPAATQQQLETRVAELEARSQELERQCSEASKKFAVEKRGMLCAQYFCFADLACV